MQGPEVPSEKEHPGPVQPGILTNLLAWTTQGPIMSRELKNSRHLPQSDRWPIQPLPFPFVLLVTQPQPVHPWRAVSLGHEVLQVQTLFTHWFFYTTLRMRSPLCYVPHTFRASECHPQSPSQSLWHPEQDQHLPPPWACAVRIIMLLSRKTCELLCTSVSSSVKRDNSSHLLIALWGLNELIA